MIYNYKDNYSRGDNLVLGKVFHKISIFLVIATLLVVFFTPVAAQNSTASLGIFEPYSVAPGSDIQVPISIKNVDGLYGYDLTLTFNPKLLQIQDSDPAAPGVQAALGSFLDPGLVLFNSADNTQGTLRFAMSQYNPSVAKSGEGILLLVNFKGITLGDSVLTFSGVQLSSREGVAIAVQTMDSTVSVNSSAPTQAATIPAANAAGVILIQTPTPTQTPVPIENVVKSATPNATLTQQGNAGQVTNSASNPSSASYFLVENWWFVLILLGLVIIAAVYFFVIRK